MSETRSQDSGSRRPPRLSQEEKSAATRERLLDATLACLHDLGYAHTTTTEVTERAGLSRGAMLHHYPSKASLVAGALAYLAERRIAEFVAAVESLADAGDSLPDVIDLLYTQFVSPSYYVVLELAVAARTDAELRAELLPCLERYDRVIADRARELFAHLAPTPEIFEMQRRIVYALLHGLAVRRLQSVDDEETKRVLTDLKRPLAGLRIERKRPSSS